MSDYGTYIGAAPRVLLFIALLGSTPSMAQDCSNGRFEGHEPYAFDESLPFDFDQPAGWDAQSVASGHRLVTVHKPHAQAAIGAIAVTIDIMVAVQPDRYPEMTEDVWRQTMDVIAKIPYADETLTIYSQSWATMAKFLVPHAGSRYQVMINFTNSEYCADEAIKLRELVIHSLTPNGNTTFPDG